MILYMGFFILQQPETLRLNSYALQAIKFEAVNK